MNRLQQETSPYLLQHANNPVEWYAWKEEAFEKAKREDKPILVSIGYSTCHWCHVMERESFENEAVAAFMNEHFVNVKVDREERPDVDQIYMEACQAINGSGGWPLNCFLLPDGSPFFAGTYYPPRQAHNRPSWMQLLSYMQKAYTEQREKVVKQSQQLMDAISQSDSLFLKEDWIAASKEALFNKEGADRVFEALKAQFDTEQGGFGGAPKFPMAMALKYLLDYHHLKGAPEARKHLERSLNAMIRGGLYDQLGGGFARYATDRGWLVPHFEKMLYDNALLVGLLSDAYRQSENPLYEATIRATLAWVEREMTGPEGGFYAALDADSEGQEGKFYIWSKSEIEQHLDPDTAALFCKYYNASEKGNWEGANILYCTQSEEAFAESQGMEYADVKAKLSDARLRLFAVRSDRPRPGLDDKVLLGWNALMSTAYAKAYAALGEQSYLAAAEDNLRFLLEKMAAPESPALLHTYKEGKAQYMAYLEDYALLIEAMLNVYQLNFDTSWLERSAALADYLIDNYLDTADKLFYFTAEGQKDLPLRRKDLYDSATPSGNSTMAHNLHRLSIFYGRDDYARLSVDMLRGMKSSIEKYPLSFARWARAVLYHSYPFYELAVVGQQAEAKAQHLGRAYFPNTVVMAAITGDERWPLLAGKSVGGDTNIFVCQEYACQQPVKTVEEAAAVLRSS